MLFLMTFDVPAVYRHLVLACVFLLVLAATGCSSSKINWAERVGSYTYDQAVLDYGPPDRSATLTDKTVVAEWLTARGYSHGYVSGGYGYSPWGYSPGPQTYTSTPASEYYIRLTFNPEGTLIDWKKVVK
jgi:hypothetical protein